MRNTSRNLPLNWYCQANSLCYLAQVSTPVRMELCLASLSPLQSQSREAVPRCGHTGIPGIVRDGGHRWQKGTFCVWGVFRERSPVPGEQGAPEAFAHRFAWTSMCCPVVLCHGAQACSTHTLIHNYFLLNLQSFGRGIILFGIVSPEHLLFFLVKWKQSVGNYLLQFLLLLACSKVLHHQWFRD